MAVKRNFGIPISELIAACRLIWTSFMQHVADFTAVSPIYTALYGAVQLAAIDAAAALPDREQREADAKMLRVALVVILKKILNQFGLLLSYNELAWDPDQLGIQNAAAGKGYLPEAENENWDKVAALLQSEANYLATNGPFLVTAGGMPGNFEADLLLLKADYTTGLADFKAARMEIPIDTDAKTLALNTINTNTKRLCKVAKRIVLPLGVGQQFDFGHVLSTVSSPKPSAIQGVVVEYGTWEVVPTAVIELVGEGVFFHVDTNGVFRIERPAGQYLLRITATPTTGNPYLVRIEYPIIEKGTVSTFNIQLVRAV